MSAPPAASRPSRASSAPVPARSAAAAAASSIAAASSVSASSSASASASAAAAAAPVGSTATAGHKRAAESEADKDAAERSGEEEQQAAAAARKRARKGSAAAAAAPSSAASAAAPASSSSAAASASSAKKPRKYSAPFDHTELLRQRRKRKAARAAAAAAAASAQHKPDHGAGHSAAAAAAGPATAPAHSLMDDETSHAAAPSHASSAAASASWSAASSSAAAAAASMVGDRAVPGGTYTGPVVDGQPEGHGQLAALDGSVYTGDFGQGKKRGIGVCRWSNGRVYAGQWESNKRVGLGAQWNARGKLTECGWWANDKFEAYAAVPLRCIPEGRWLSAAALQAKRDHPNGSLVLLHKDGEFFLGAVNADGQPDGDGASFRANGKAFCTPIKSDPDKSKHGRWKACDLNGPFTMLDSNGDQFEGMFNANQREGLGVYIRKNGLRYEGGWLADKQTGLGAQWNKDGKLTHCGRWADGMLVKSCAVPLRCIPDGRWLSAAALKAKRDHPNDSALLPDGAHYIGQLNADGQPHGQGAIFHPDSASHITLLVDAVANKSGCFIDGQLHGRASVRYSEGVCYDGLFKDDCFEGLGVYITADGRRYEGEFAADLFCGLGAEWSNDGKLTHCGRWKHDKFLTSCAVPVHCLPEKRFLSPHAKTASLLFPDGGYYVGPINARNQRHGVGQMFSVSDDLLSSGRWSNDQPPSGSASSVIAATDTLAAPAADAAAASASASPDSAVSLMSAALANAQLQANSVSAQIAPAPPAAAASASSSSAAAAASSSSSSSAMQLPLQCSNRKALIIGNSKYDAPVKSLACCTNDAEDMHVALQQLGFQCTRLLNAPRKQINEALIDFIQSLEKKDIVFFHFSGHGEESAGVTYLLPTDYGRSESLEDDAVSLNKIMQRLNQKNCDLINIIMLDCCRANAQDDTFRGSDEIMRSAMSGVDDRAGQSFVRKPMSGHFFIAFSSDPGTVSFETTGGRNGWFTGCVLRHLLTPGLRITEIFGKAAGSLDEKHGEKQRSWIQLTASFFELDFIIRLR